MQSRYNFYFDEFPLEILERNTNYYTDQGDQFFYDNILPPNLVKFFDNTDIPQVMGLPLFREAALIWLIKKHPNTCVLSDDDINMEWNLDQKKLYGNFSELQNRINHCKYKKMNYIYLSFTIVFRGGAHANYILIDTKQNTAYRFDPQIDLSETTDLLSTGYRRSQHVMKLRKEGSVARAPPKHENRMFLIENLVHKSGNTLETQLNYLFNDYLKINYIGLSPCYYNLQNIIEKTTNIDLINAKASKKDINAFIDMELTGGLCYFWSIWIADKAMTQNKTPNEIVSKLLFTIEGESIASRTRTRRLKSLTHNLNYSKLYELKKRTTRIAIDILRDLRKTVMKGVYNIIKNFISKLPPQYKNCLRIIYMNDLSHLKYKEYLKYSNIKLTKDEKNSLKLLKSMNKQALNMCKDKILPLLWESRNELGLKRRVRSTDRMKYFTYAE